MVSNPMSISLSELLSCTASCANPMKFQEIEPTCIQSGFTAAASSALQLAGDPWLYPPSSSPPVGRQPTGGAGGEGQGRGSSYKRPPEGMMGDHLGGDSP